MTEPGNAGSFRPPGGAPLLLLFGCGIAWLLLGAVLALIASIQLHTPAYFAACPFLTYGRTQAMAETAILYGWIGNAGLGVSLWILCRLAGEPLRAAPWAVVGAIFWNIGLAIGLAGIAAGDATAIPSLQLPRYVQPLLLAAYCAAAVPGVLAWAGRRREFMFTAQAYAVAPLFLFPWLFSAAQETLVWSPARGVAQAVAGGWYAEGLQFLWMAPLALAGAYYVVPRITGRTIPGYEFASHGFWCLLFVGGWLGGRHLIGGPVPAWIGTVAVVASVVLLFHFAVVFLNLRDCFGRGGGPLGFAAFGLLAYGLAGIANAAGALRVVAAAVDFTFFQQAQEQLLIWGFGTMMLHATLCFAVPALAGRPWASASFKRGHFALSAIGAAALVICLAQAGLVQAAGLRNPGMAFADIAGRTQPWLLGATASRLVLLVANLILAVNFARTARRAPAVFPQAGVASP